MSLFLKIIVALSLLTACGDKTKNNKSDPAGTDSGTPSQNSGNSTAPAPTTEPLTQSKLEWDGINLKGTADFMVVPMD